MPHTHIIDGKLQTFDDNTCPFCHPERTQQKQEEKGEILPRAYRTANAVVLKISKTRLITLSPYPKEKCYLLSISKMMFDKDRKAILDAQQNPLWTKITVRVNAFALKDFINHTATLITETETQATTPARD